MSKSIQELRAALLKSRPSHPSAGYPPELRSAATSWLRDRRAAGDDWGTLSRELGISQTTARSWAERAAQGDEGSASFLPIRLNETAPGSSPPLAPNPAAMSPGPVLVTPRGYRVEGMDAELLVAVLERVG